ncbi:MAG TPA: family 16 glycosylhydrolase [Pseudomonadales bacterium]|nr:family 16 glycosylhydrolase [Pseudomonadales bacterium]
MNSVQLLLVCLTICLPARAQSNISNPPGTNHISAPPPALEINYTNLTFHDEFDSISTIDVNNTQTPGYNWYVQVPFHGGVARRDEYDVTNGVLQINADHSYGWVLSTWSGTNGTGHVFRYGYFEARVHFDPTKGPVSKSWPAFWSFPVEHAWGRAKAHWNELDFFEAYTGGYTNYNGGFYGTVHDWTFNGIRKPKNHQNKNNYTPLSVDWNQWHVLGCLWAPGNISWYLDNARLQTVHYSTNYTGIDPDVNASTNNLYSIMDSQNNLVILGSSKGWPLYVDYVRIWQK